MLEFEVCNNNNLYFLGFFISGFPKLLRFQSHHDRIVSKLLPKLHKHFNKHGVDSNLYTLKWFFLCFLDRVPFPLALRLWDIYFLEGDRTLITAAYMILKIHQKTLLSMKNFDDILNFLQVTLPEDFIVDIDTVITVHYHKCLEDLRRKKLDTAGDPADDELPQLPFGFLDNIKTLIPPPRVPSAQSEPVAIITVEKASAHKDEVLAKSPPKAEQEDSRIVPEEEEEQSSSLVTNSDKFYHSSENSSLSSSFFVPQTGKTNGGQSSASESNFTKNATDFQNASISHSNHSVQHGNAHNINSSSVINNSTYSPEMSSSQQVLKSPQKKSVITITMSAVSNNSKSNGTTPPKHSPFGGIDGGDNNSSSDSIKLVVKNDSYNNDSNNSFNSPGSTSVVDCKGNSEKFDHQHSNEVYVTTIPVTPMEN